MILQPKTNNNHVKTALSPSYSYSTALLKRLYHKLKAMLLQDQKPALTTTKPNLQTTIHAYPADLWQVSENH